MGAPDCQLLQRQKEPKTKEMRCGSSVWFESWQSFLTETRTPCYIPNCEVRTHKARAWRVLVTTSVCAAPWEVPGSLPNSFFFLEASVQGYRPRCRARCQWIYCSGIMQITLKKRDHCSSASRPVHLHPPFNA